MAELQRKLSLSALVNINVSATSRKLVTENGYLICAQATVDNVGTRRTSLRFPNDLRPFFAVRVDVIENGNLQIGQPIRTGIPYGDGSQNFSQRSIVGPGSRVDLPFVFYVKQTGSILGVIFCNPFR